MNMSPEREVGPPVDLPPGSVTGAGPYAVGNIGGEFFAVSRRCRHLGADLADGTLDDQGRLVCPWHQSAYDVRTGRMVRGPQGVRTIAREPARGALVAERLAWREPTAVESGQGGGNGLV